MMIVEPVGFRDKHLSATSEFRYTTKTHVSQIQESKSGHQDWVGGCLRFDDHMVQGANSLSSRSERMASINAPRSVGCIDVGGATSPSASPPLQNANRG